MLGYNICKIVFELRIIKNRFKQLFYLSVNYLEKPIRIVIVKLTCIRNKIILIRGDILKY